MRIQQAGFVLFAVGAMIAASAPATFAERAEAGKSKVVAYVPNWRELKTFADTIDYAHITHINIAFENPINAGGELSLSSKNDILIKKAHERHVPVLISIGGGAVAGNKTLLARYFDLITDAKRSAFVAKLADYVTVHHFDGLDVDLEGPAINKDYGAFIQALSRALKPKGKRLTAALSQGYGGSMVPDSALACFDWINIMAYDATGNWNPNAPGQHSSLEYAKNSVDYWLKRGLPKAKAVLGVPFYGYGFGAAFRNDGYAYSEIVTTYPGAENADQIGTTIWYNGLATIKAKAEYAKVQGLGGVMIWSLDQDAPGEKSLLSTLAKALGH